MIDNTIIWKDTLASADACDEYKSEFLSRFSIDADDPFLFDGLDIFDGVTGEKILNIDAFPWRYVTNRLIKYFHLEEN